MPLEKQSLNNFLPNKRKDLIEKYKIIFNYISKFQKEFNKKNIINSHLTLCEMFVSLCELQHTIDAEIYQDIVEKFFKALYYQYLEKINKFESCDCNLTESEKNLYDFVKQRDKDTDIKRAVIDYIAGQTDQYFLNECMEHLKHINVKELYNKFV